MFRIAAWHQSVAAPYAAFRSPIVELFQNAELQRSREIAPVAPGGIPSLHRGYVLCEGSW